MLRSWRDRYNVALCPERLLAVRRRPGPRTVVDFKIAESFTPPASGPIWKAAAETLARFLESLPVRRGEVGIVLSNHFVRYLLVPWNAHIASAAEFGSYVAAAFADVYGEMHSEWQIMVSAERAGSPRLAAAADRALLQAIRDSVGAARLRLASVQPYLMAAFNAFGRRRRETDFAFVVLEAKRLCLLAAQGGAWRHVSVSGAPDDPVQLAALLERELCLARLDQEVPAVFVHAGDRSGLTLPPLFGKAAHVLDCVLPAGLAPSSDAAFAMAVSTV